MATASASAAAKDEAQAPFTRTFARLGRTVWLTLESSYRADASRAVDVEKRLAEVGDQVKQLSDMGVSLMAVGEWSTRHTWSDEQWKAFLRTWRNYYSIPFDKASTTEDEKRLIALFDVYWTFYACLPKRPEGEIPNEDFETIQKVGKQVDQALGGFAERLGDPVEPCRACNKFAIGRKLKRCTRCKQTHYCEQTCQKKDWRAHKRKCIPILQQDPKHVDKLVRGRYRMLCRQGKNSKVAMQIARAEYDQDKKDAVSAGASEQVAAMFGLS